MLCTCNTKNVLCSVEKSSVIWAERHSRSLAEQFGQTERSVDHYSARERQNEGRKPNGLDLRGSYQQDDITNSYIIFLNFFK